MQTRQIYLFLPTLDDLISYSCLIALTRFFSSMLNRKGEEGAPCLVPTSRKRFQSFTIECGVNFLKACHKYDIYYVEEHSIFTQFVESSYHERM